MTERLDYPDPGDITRLLNRWRSGDGVAFEELIPWIDRELHKLAASFFRAERAGHTLQPTALVNELYLRMAAGSAPDVTGRRQFYGVAARVMRAILIDHARRKLAAKRGAGATVVQMDEVLVYSSDRAMEFAALDDALDELAHVNERSARVVELRFFTGLSVDEVADTMGVSPSSVARDYRFALAFLSDRLGAA